MSQQSKAMKSLIADFKKTSRESQTVDASKYYDWNVPILEFFTGLRELGVLTLALGISSEANGGQLKQTEEGRATLWCRVDNHERNYTLSKSVTKAVAGLLGDENLRTEYGAEAGVAAFRLAAAAIANRKVGKHTETGALTIF
jgi:hypothetical protein